MKIKLLLTTALLSFSIAEGYTQNEQERQPIENSGEQLLHERQSRIKFGGYAQLNYNQQFSRSIRYNGKLDPRRFVLFTGYQFNKRLNFVSEMEIEHGNEIYLEQAFINYQLDPRFQFRGGVMLIPMGIINEYHEPTLFNGVERPSICNALIPTTWREMGAGFQGRFDKAALRYQAYLFTGFNGYDTDARFNGRTALRGGRQKAINSYMSSPNLSVKLDYYGINNLNLGLSGYFGKSQSKLYDKMDKGSESARLKADSTVVGIAMVGVDARYRISGLELRGEYVYTSVSNTDQYNTFNRKSLDLGSAMAGGYAEVGYNLLYGRGDGRKKLVPFVRYENYNMHQQTDLIMANKAYHTQEWFAGIGFWPAPGVVFKVDYQSRKSADDNAVRENWINCGIGVTF